MSKEITHTVKVDKYGNKIRVEYANGKKFWYKDGKLHREDGPAIECADVCCKCWYLEGVELTEKEFNDKINSPKALKFSQNIYKQNPGTSPIVRRTGHKSRIPVRATEFVELTDLVPKTWCDWFYTALAETGNVTWGDANRTFISAEYLADIAADMEFQTTKGAKRKWLKKVHQLNQMYVDLEN